jgi:hypothetical protein
VASSGAYGSGQVIGSVSGGGAGGYSRKYIASSALGSTEAVTVGTGASATAGAGIVIVYEYAK